MKQRSADDVKNLLDKLGSQLFNIENYYLIYSELGLHYNKTVHEDSAKAYLEVINSHKGFFIPAQNALRSALTVELHQFIVANDEESLKKAIYYLSALEDAPDLRREYNTLLSKNKNAIKHLSDFRNKYFAHKSGVDTSKLTATSDKEFQELFTDIKELLNKASGYFGSTTWFFDRDSSDAVRNTHEMMNNLLRGESQRLNEIDVEYISSAYEAGRSKWLGND